MKTPETNRYSTFQEELESLRAKQQFRQLGAIAHRDSTDADFNGQRYLNLSSNDYLGLGGSQPLLDEFLQQDSGEDRLDQFGLAGSSSRLLTGNSQAYDALEHELAELYQAEAACVFNSGYHANIGIISALAGRHDLVLSDKLNHASMMDGLKITDAEFIRYRHLDYDHLESLLKKHRDHYRRLFIMTESVFSMDGDVADLAALVELKNRYQAFLIVDEAHAVGVFGEHGCGVCEEQELIPEIDVIVGTFGKAFASLGAFAITNSVLKDYLVNTMRSLIFTTALPPIIVNWNRFLLQKIQGMQTERVHLRELGRKFKQALIEQSLQTDGDSQIVPVIIGENQKTLALSERLRERGWLIFAIRPPTVPPNTSRLRLSFNAEMTWEQLETIPSVIGALAREC